MKKKKVDVVYIITQLELGGAQKVCLALFNGLQHHAMQCTLLTSKGKLSETITHNEHILYINTLKRSVSWRSWFNEIKTFFFIIKQLRALKRKNPTLIVHTHSTKAGLLGRWAAFFARIPIRIHTIHGFAFHQHQNWIVWLLLYIPELITSFITTHFVCVSSEDAKTGKRLLPTFEKKHSIIRAAIEWNNFYIPAYNALSFDERQHFIFGTIACFKPQKNLFDLLQAFERVYHANAKARLEIIGDGQLRPAIERWIHQHQLQHVITLQGWQENVAPYMMHWHAFVLSSLWEGLPCAIVEARLLKLPVLSYNTGGIHDVIISGKNGFLYKQKDWESLAQGMLTLSLHKKLHHQLQHYQDDLTDFHHEVMIAEHSQLYKKLINGK